MAKNSNTTVPSFTEPRTGGLRAMFARFTALVGSLVELTDAERDLGGYQGQDPALSAFTGAVDTARAQTLTHCAVIVAGETEDEMAHGMQTVARMVRTVLTADTFSEVAIIRNLLSMRNETVLFPVFRPGHDRYNSVMERAFSALASYIALPGTGTAAADRGLMARLSEGTNVAHTAMSRNFTGLLGAMERYIRAEQPLQRPLAGDVRAEPFARAMEQAEATLKALHGALHDVMVADLVRPEDGALWELGYALFTLMAKNDDADRAFFFDTIMAYQPGFMVPGPHAVARRTREMQVRYFQLIEQMMALQDFGGPGPDDDGASWPMLAA
ncbi:hypothetical protein [Albidovulum sp.]|uniref:hypothetical protein n=1 Tax=Albidovulum sp. TaxID=1872424 RepID=UPI0039B8820E